MPRIFLGKPLREVLTQVLGALQADNKVDKCCPLGTSLCEKILDNAELVEEMLGFRVAQEPAEPSQHNNQPYSYKDPETK